MEYTQRTAVPAGPSANKRITDKVLIHQTELGVRRRSSQKKTYNKSVQKLEALEGKQKVVVQDPKLNTWSSDGIVVYVRNGEKNKGYVCSVKNKTGVFK